jgi:hypothetical protein
MGKAIRLALSVGLLFAGGSAAFGQAGSTGGMIGNTDKSISGEEAPHRMTPAKKPLARTTTGSPCAHLAGSWMLTWFNGRTIVTLLADGAASTPKGKGSWTCTGRRLVIVWSSGEGGPEVMTLSPDAKSATGRGTMGISINFARVSR